MADNVIKQIAVDVFAIIDNPRIRKAILEKATAAVKLLARAYPPPGIWNRLPGTRGDGRYYARGYGARWQRANGTFGGKPTSQKLNESWQEEIRDDTASVYTSVTYAPYLFDPQQRANWAKPHGWQSVDDVEEKATEELDKLIADEIDKQLEEL